MDIQEAREARTSSLISNIADAYSDKPKWESLFNELKNSGLRVKPDEILTKAFSAGFSVGLNRKEDPFLIAGKLLKDVAYRGDTPEEEIVRERVSILDEVLLQERSPQELGLVRDARKLVTGVLFPEYFTL